MELKGRTGPEFSLIPSNFALFLFPQILYNGHVMRINKKKVWKKAEPTLNCFGNVTWCSLSDICFCFCLFYALLCCTRMNTINKSLISLPLNLFASGTLLTLFLVVFNIWHLMKFWISSFSRHISWSPPPWSLSLWEEKPLLQISNRQI